MTLAQAAQSVQPDPRGHLGRKAHKGSQARLALSALPVLWDLQAQWAQPGRKEPRGLLARSGRLGPPVHKGRPVRRAQQDRKELKGSPVSRDP